MRTWTRCAGDPCRWRGITVVLVMAATVGACAGGGTLGDVLGGVLGGQSPAGGGTLVAEIQDVDTYQGTLEVRTEDGQQGDIAYDDRTQVVYQNQQYPVTALEPGGVVEMNVQETSGGALYTDYIRVRQSVQQRQDDYGGDYDGQRVRAQGEVRAIDHDGGRFDLATNQGTFTVTLPYNPASGTVYTFQRLERGDYVALEGELVADDRIELIRFVD